MKKEKLDRMEKKVLNYSELEEPPRYEDIKYISFTLSDFLFLIYLQFYIFNILEINFWNKFFIFILKTKKLIIFNLARDYTKLRKLFLKIDNSIKKFFIKFNYSTKEFFNNLGSDLIKIQNFAKEFFNQIITFLLNIQILIKLSVQKNILLFESKKAEFNKIMFFVIFVVLVFSLLTGLRESVAFPEDGTACAYDTQCTNWCDAEDGEAGHEALSGLSTDDELCYSGVACAGGATRCDSNTGDCQVNLGASATCDDYPEGSCVGTSGYCDTNCLYTTDGDSSSAACTCRVGSGHYVTALGTWTGSNYQCCGDDTTSDDFSTYSGSLITSTTLNCDRCANGVDASTSSLCGNGYFSSSNTLCTAATKTTATSGYCYYSNIVCSYSSAANGAVSSLLYGNGYTSSSRTSATSLVCYYTDIICADESASSSASGTYYGNGYLNDGTDTCYFGDITCADESAGDGTSEICEDSCVNDNNGGSCVNTHTPASTETCYYTESCVDTTGCEYASSTALRQYYCDTCGASGVTSGDYCPASGTSSTNTCYYGTQSCTSTTCNSNQDTTIYSSVAWTVCEDSSQTGSDDYCFDDDTNYCYYQSGDSCDATYGWGDSVATDFNRDSCTDEGVVTGAGTSSATCFYDEGCASTGANAGCENGELVTAVITCDDYTNWIDGAGYCYKDASNACYYASSDLCAADNDGWDYSTDTCYDSGSVTSGGSSSARCYYSEGCSASGASASCETGELVTDVVTCDSYTNWNDGAGYCLSSSNNACYSASSDLCGADSDGWDYSTDSACYGDADGEPDIVSGYCYYGTESCIASGCTDGASTAGPETNWAGCEGGNSQTDSNMYCFSPDSDSCYYQTTDACDTTIGWDYSTDSACYGDADGEPDIASGYCYYGTETCSASGCTDGTSEAGPASNWVDCDASSQTDSSMYCVDYSADTCYYQTTDACDTTVGWDYSTDSACYGDLDGTADIVSELCYYGSESCTASGCTDGASDDGPGAIAWSACDVNGVNGGSYSAVDDNAWCFDDSANTCYYDTSNNNCDETSGWNLASTTCYDPGTVSGTTCYYDNGGSVDESDSCTSSGCTGISGEAAPVSCDSGSFADGAMACGVYTTDICYYNAIDGCASDIDGWDYATYDCDAYDDTSLGDTLLRESELNTTSCASTCTGTGCCAVQTITCSGTYECNGFHDLINNEDETSNAICYYSNAGAWSWGANADASETSCTDGYDNDCDGNTDDADSDCVCSSGNDCSGTDICIAGNCRAACSDTYDGSTCSPDGSSTAHISYGICTLETGSGWSCDASEAAYDGSDYLFDCSDSASSYGEQCDNNTLAGGYSVNGVCGGTSHNTCFADYASDTTSAITASSVFGTQTTVCDTEDGYYCDNVNDGSFVPGTQRCDADDNVCDACDAGNIGDDGNCEAVCGADSQCDESSALTCPAQGYICTSTCVYTDRDSAQSYCEDSTGCTAYEWNIGGEIDATTCCGDDATNNNIDSTYGVSIEVPPTLTDACCDTNSDCVNSNTCYADTSTADVDSTGDNDVCSSGTWIDCNTIAECDPTGEYAEGESSQACSSGTECSEACTSNDCIYLRENGWADCDLDSACVSGNCEQDTEYYQPSSSACDSAVGAICSAGAGWDVCIPSTGCAYDSDHDGVMSDCINGQEGGNCYANSGDVDKDVDNDGNNDYCLSGTWYDCNTNSECDTGYTCVANDCIDNSAPTCSVTGISENTNLGYQYVTGTTVYYNTESIGQFTISATSTDSGSGVHNLTFPTTVSAGSADISSPYTHQYTWATDDTYSSAATVTCYDTSGNSNTDTFTVTRDVTDPASGSITYSDGFYTSTSVGITYSTGTDGGSGLNTSTGRILRQSATLSAGSCGGYGAWSELVKESDGSYTDSTVASGNCYMYRYEIFDNVLNGVNYTSASVAKIDTTSPTCSVSGISENTNIGYQYVSGTTVYYNTESTGQFTVTATAASATSGIHNVTFPTTVSAGGVDTSSAYTNQYTWATDDTYSTTATVTCYANSGASNTDTFDVTRDVTDPASGSITYSNGYLDTVTITFTDGTDSGAGLNSSNTHLLRREANILDDNLCGTYGSWSQIGSNNPTSPYDDSSVAHAKCYQFRYEVFDNVLNGFNYTSSNTIKTNNKPTQDSPTISPSTPTSISNLTCDWANVVDIDSDSITNITTWYKNNKSTTILYLPFEGNGNEANNATDYSGYGNNGTVFGATFNKTGGKVGGAYDFDGTNDYISITNNPSLTITNPITISTWVKENNDVAMSRFVIDKASNGGYRIMTYVNYPYFYVYNSTGGYCAAYKYTKLGTDWKNIVGVYDGTSAFVYVDGVLWANQTCSQDFVFAPSTVNVAIGAQSNGGGARWNGSIDEVKIYNYSLSSDQIYQEYLAGSLGKNSQILIFNETDDYDEWLCSVTPNDGFENGINKNSSSVIIANNLPVINEPSFNPSSVSTLNDIECKATPNDLDDQIVTVEWYWYNGTNVKLSGNTTSLPSGIESVITTLGSGNTSKGEIWNCTVRVYDGTIHSAFNSSVITIENTAPGKPTLISPSNGNTSLIYAKPTFSWTNITNIDNDPLNFTLNITSSSCPNFGLFEKITALNYTLTTELILDCNYTWQVRAYDGIEYGHWSDNFTLKIYPTIILTLINNSIDFGTLAINESADTENLGGPFVVRNDGNVFANITWVSINQSLFTSVGTNTPYLRFKIDNTTKEPRSFNYSNSTITWTNLDLITQSNKTAVGYLNYSDASDEAEIDINITVPIDEPSGLKSILMYIIGQES